MVVPIQSQWLKSGTEEKMGCNCEKNRCPRLPFWGKKKKKKSVNLFLGISQKAADLRK